MLKTQIQTHLMPTLVVGLALAVASMGCERESKETMPDEEPTQTAEQPQAEEADAEPTPAEPMTFTADLSALNSDLTEDDVSGSAELTVEGEELQIVVEAQGLPPNMTVLQHFHGFEDGAREASCPSQDQDANDDGVVDLIETEAVAGVTMVPFTENPASMDILGGTYPETDEQGRLSYTQSVSMEELRDGFEEKFGTRELDLANRVVFLHGVPEDTELPDTAQSLEGVPAHVTVPIACGEL